MSAGSSKASQRQWEYRTEFLMDRSNWVIVFFIDFSVRQLLGQLVAPFLCRNTVLTAQDWVILSRTNAQLKLPPCSTTFCHWQIAVLLIAAVTSPFRFVQCGNQTHSSCICETYTDSSVSWPIEGFLAVSPLHSTAFRRLKSPPALSLVCNFSTTDLETTASF